MSWPPNQHLPAPTHHPLRVCNYHVCLNLGGRGSRPKRGGSSDLCLAGDLRCLGTLHPTSPQNSGRLSVQAGSLPGHKKATQALSYDSTDPELEPQGPTLVPEVGLLSWLRDWL